MTLSNTERSITVTGNSLTTIFSYDFPMGGSANYAQLFLTDGAGNESQVATASFSITGVTSEDGGTFTYPLSGSPITAGESLTLYRTVPLVQSAAIGNQGNFYPSTVEGALDYQMMALQQLASGSGQTIDPVSLFGNPGASSGAGQSIGLGAGLSFSGTTIVVSGISGSGTVTSVDTGDGLTGGPVTGVGTISMAPIAASSLLANPTTASAVPTAVTLGTGLSFSGTTLTTSFGLIGSVVAAGSTASATFTAIPQTYKDLIISIQGRIIRAGQTSDQLAMRFNSDTGSNYHYVVCNAGTGNVTAVDENGVASFAVGALPASTATANYAGQHDVVVNNYTGTTFFKNFTSVNASSIAGTSPNTFLQPSGGMWASTAAVTSIVFFPTAGTGFVDGTIFALYGRR